MTTLFRHELVAQFIQFICIAGRAMYLMADLLRQNRAPSQIVRC